MLKVSLLPKKEAPQRAQKTSQHTVMASFQTHIRHQAELTGAWQGAIALKSLHPCLNLPLCTTHHLHLPR